MSSQDDVINWLQDPDNREALYALLARGVAQSSETSYVTAAFNFSYLVGRLPRKEGHDGPSTSKAEEENLSETPVR